VDGAGYVWVFRKDLRQQRSIGNIATVEASVKGELLPAADKGIEDDGDMTLVLQGGGNGTANIARASCDEYFHSITTS